MKLWRRFFVVVLVLVLAVMLSASCDLLTGLFGGEDTLDPDAPVPELSFTPAVVTLGALESRVVINGNVGGEDISFAWDFQPVGLVTNGLLDSQIVSEFPDNVSLWMDNDFNATYNPQDAGEWYLRFTLGNLRKTDSVLNAKETFAIPERPYAMITLRKGPDGIEYRHREYDSTNKLCVIVTDVTYDTTANTLWLQGGLKSTWGADDADWVTADFNVLFGGTDDRKASLNKSTLEYCWE